MTGSKAHPRFPGGRRSDRPLRFRCRRIARLCLGLGCGLAGSLRADTADQLAPLSFGFSTQLFADVNENDARAALMAWAQALSAQRRIPVDPEMKLYNGTESLKHALLGKSVDAVTITTVEYWALRRDVLLGPIILGRTHGGVTEEYLLLVHRDNPATRLADLKGQSMGVLRGPRASLAAPWMETLLLEENLGLARTFWKKVTHDSKLSRVVLPVFFRQADACVVTREGFRTMSELNPQVGRQLKILAQSPPLVPDLFCFREELVSPHRDRLLVEIGRIVETTVGRQTLMLFQSDDLEVRPASDLEAACALLDRHQLLSAAAREAGAPPPIGPAALALGRKDE